MNQAAPISDNLVTKASHDIEAMTQLLDRQKQAFRAFPYPTYKERIQKLKTLKSLILKYQEPLAEALYKDFSARSHNETKMAEVMTSIEGINKALHDLKKWMKPKGRKISLLWAPGKNQVIYQPKGVVGIIVPWNYPFYLTIGPLTGALAAGNRAMIKYSEFTPHANQVMIQMLKEGFDELEVSHVEGEAEVGAAFSGLPFDHIFFTGSTSVGRHVMAAAAKNLTPVTLELGGKSPTIIGEQANIKEAANRIVWGKSLNAGQTCVAPDYILCPNNKVDEFVAEAKAAFSEFYPTLKNNDDYTAIINDRQYQRLLNWKEQAADKGATLIDANPANEDLTGTRKLTLTFSVNTPEGTHLADDEIFGPILPIIGYETEQEAIDYIKARPHPLALYYFSHDKKAQKNMLEQTHSGGVAINDCVIHLAQDDMPFGGVGDSGMGHYHGHEGFLTFSHAKSVHKKGLINTTKLASPPYDKFIHKALFKLFIR